MATETILHRETTTLPHPHPPKSPRPVGGRGLLPKYVSTTNACKLCKPLGACLAFRGIEGSVPYLHGSQGCATYMRRYIISHFNEPIDIASSSLGEKNAIYGGGANLKQGLKNVTDKYQPQMIGIATTCLTETIGDDLNLIVHEYRKEAGESAKMPILVKVSTPSYSGTHMEGFHAAVLSVLATLCEETPPNGRVNILPGFLSPADLRYLKEVLAAFALSATVLPDISDTLDGPALDEYQLIPAGGTPLGEIRTMGGAAATIEFGSTISDKESGGTFLEKSFGVGKQRLTMPIGVAATDRFFAALAGLSGKATPARYAGARGRLIDSLVDGHKYVFGKKAVVYGEEDLVVALAGFLAEIGVQPVLCASGGKSGRLKEAVAAVTDGLCEVAPETYDDIDFHEIESRATELAPDLIIGHSKGYPLARKLAIPLIRVGFPIHDRVGGQRILHIGYEGAQHLFDRIANAMIQVKQDSSPVGYSYM
ncbi:MAG: nitrogenase [Proteobacteria bacterium]|nr:nitrogenase [Pseudomonadota bacterium]MBU1737761.1 nitrogenase [Pseudomonadota bacterium]